MTLKLFALVTEDEEDEAAGSGATVEAIDEIALSVNATVVFNTCPLSSTTVEFAEGT